jgi:predicted nucleic acid-binding protein
MSGDKRLLLDTNAVVAPLQGHPFLVSQTQDADWVGISIITSLEFFCFAGLTQQDRELFTEFSRRVEVIPLDPGNPQLVEVTVQLRRDDRLKLPDAIVATTAITQDAALLTADQQLAGIRDLRTISFQP